MSLVNVQMSALWFTTCLKILTASRNVLFPLSVHRPTGHVPFVGPMPPRSRETQSDHMMKPDTPNCLSNTFSTACSRSKHTHARVCTHTLAHCFLTFLFGTFCSFILSVFKLCVSSLPYLLLESVYLPFSHVCRLSLLSVSDLPDPPFFEFCVCVYLHMHAPQLCKHCLVSPINAGLWYMIVWVFSVWVSEWEVFRHPGACLSVCCVSDKSYDI